MSDNVKKGACISLDILRAITKECNPWKKEKTATQLINIKTEDVWNNLAILIIVGGQTY